MPPHRPAPPEKLPVSLSDELRTLARMLDRGDRVLVMVGTGICYGASEQIMLPGSAF